MLRMSDEIKAAEKEKWRLELAAGDAFAALREKKHPNMRMTDSFEKMGITVGDNSNWTKPLANGRTRIVATKLDGIATGLELSAAEKQGLLHARLPALKKEWLAQQPLQVRGGWLMAAYRDLKGLIQKDLTEAFGVSEPISISQRERGIIRSGLDAGGLEKLAQKLGVPEAEQDYFVQQIMASDKEIGTRTRVHNRNEQDMKNLVVESSSCHTGAEFPARHNPELAQQISELLGEGRK